MQVDVIKYTDRKGITSRDLFGVIPVGKRGHSITQFLTNGTLTMTLNNSIHDNDIRTAVIILNFIIQKLGKESVDEIRNGSKVEVIGGNGQLTYTTGVQIKAADMSGLLYHGDRKRGKRVLNSIIFLSNINIRYHVGTDDYNMNLFQNVAYTGGNIVFDIADYLLVGMIRSMVTFRLQAILENDGFSARLALYTEMKQRPYRTCKDSSGRTNTKYVPLNEYRLEDIVTSLSIQNLRSNRAIKNIQEAFNNIRKNSKGKFPKFAYNKVRKTFESEYKNGRKSIEKQ